MKWDRGAGPLAGLTFLVLVSGCPPPPPHISPTCAAVLAKVAAADVVARLEAGGADETCVIAVAQNDRGRAVELADALSSSSAVGSAKLAASLLPLAAIDDAARPAVTRRVASRLGEQGDLSIAEALLKNLQNDRRLPRQELLDVLIQLGELRLQQGDKREALNYWGEAIAGDPDAVRTASRLVSVLLSLGESGRAEAVAFCSKLGSEPARKAQADACFSAAGDAIPISMLIETFKSKSAITSEDAKRLAENPRLSFMADRTRSCYERADPVHMGFAWDHVGALRAGALSAESLSIATSIYSKILDADASLVERQRRCFAALSADGCYVEILRSRHCSAPRSLALYVETTIASSESAGEDIRQFTEALFGLKAELYPKLQTTREPSERAQILETLFHVHVALAHAFKKFPGSKTYETSAYHEQRALVVWRDLVTVSPGPLAPSPPAGTFP